MNARYDGTEIQVKLFLDLPRYAIAFILPLVMLLKNAEEGAEDRVVAVEVIMVASSDEDGDSAIMATLDVL